MEEAIKRWTVQRKSALVLEIIRGKTTIALASRHFDLTPSEIESWVEDGKRGLGMFADPLDSAGTAGRSIYGLDQPTVSLVRAATSDGVLTPDQDAREGAA